MTSDDNVFLLRGLAAGFLLLSFLSTRFFTDSFSNLPHSGQKEVHQSQYSETFLSRYYFNYLIYFDYLNCLNYLNYLLTYNVFVASDISRCYVPHFGMYSCGRGPNLPLLIN